LGGQLSPEYPRDEIETITKEYISAYDFFQKSITQVLNKSKNIGNLELIQEKINTLTGSLAKVNTSFMDNVNL
jgi:hypothetical protein